MLNPSTVRRNNPMRRKTNKSIDTVSNTAGRWTFTATVAPLLLRTPLYTCPKLAAATGSGPSSEYTSCHLHPNSFSSVWKASSLSNEGTLSHNFCNSTIACGPSKSGRIASAWPSLMYAGPNDVTISRSWIARFTEFSSVFFVMKSATKPLINPPPIVASWNALWTTAPDRFDQ